VTLKICLFVFILTTYYQERGEAKVALKPPLALREGASDSGVNKLGIAIKMYKHCRMSLRKPDIKHKWNTSRLLVDSNVEHLCWFIAFFFDLASGLPS